MSEKVHHIRLLAGLEIQPGQSFERTLDRHQTERLAGFLASDLRRTVPEVSAAMLTVGGCLLEPAELIRPGLPVWSALESLSESTLRERGFEPRIMAIGAHRGRLPEPGLQPPSTPVQGQFITLPLLLSGPAEHTEALRSDLEEKLFERAGIDPPARALLNETLGLQSVHGQLLTLADLVALQHVQYDSAGLGGFWPLVRSAIFSEDETVDSELPGGLSARIETDQQVLIDFLSYNQCVDHDLDPALWQRAFRVLTALLDAHQVNWRLQAKAPVRHDPDQNLMIEISGRSSAPPGVTVHQHPDIGLLAWSVVEDGQLIHLFPLSAESINHVLADLAARGLTRFDDQQRVNVHPRTRHLRPAGS